MIVSWARRITTRYGFDSSRKPCSAHTMRQRAVGLRGTTVPVCFQQGSTTAVAQYEWVETGQDRKKAIPCAIVAVQNLTTSTPYPHNTKSVTTSISQPCPRNRPRRPIGLGDVEDPTLSWQWWRSCQLYAPAALYRQKSSGTHFCYRLSNLGSHCGLERLGALKK
jgi:hypothetical protein